MCAQKSELKNYTAIFLLYYALKCIAVVSTHPTTHHINQAVGYDINWPHGRHFPWTSSNDNTNSEYWQVSHEQHPWERRPFSRNHDPIFRSGLVVNAYKNEQFEQISKEPTADVNTPSYTFSHTTGWLSVPRLSGNGLDTEIGVADPHHPWRLQWPHRRHRFRHHRWHCAHIEPYTDDLSGADVQAGTNKRNNGNRWWENVEPQKPSVDSNKKEEETDSSIDNIYTTKETTRPTTIAIASATEETPSTANTFTTEGPTLFKKTKILKTDETTTVANSPTTLTSDNTSNFGMTGYTIGIDLRSGFA